MPEMTLLEWILEKNNTEGWRAGNVTGEKHPEITGEVLRRVGRGPLMEQAAQLEALGLIRVDRRELGSDISRVHYRIEDVDRMYQLAGLPNPRRELEQARQRVDACRRELASRAFDPYYEELLRQIDGGNIPKNVKIPHFLEGLNAAADNPEPVWEAQFSARVFNHSKVFKETLKPRLLTVLRKYGPGIDDGMSDGEVLAEFGIFTYSQTLQFKGPLTVQTRQGREEESAVIGRVNGNQFPYGTVLNAQTLEHSRPSGLEGIRRVITIENQANYESAVYRADTLYVFCHGFLSPKEREFLKMIPAAAEPETEYLHWSDMDYGGIRIYRYMKKHVFPEVLPLHMDRDSYLKYLKAGCVIPIDAGKRRKLDAMDAQELEELKQCILEYGMEIEQEHLLKGRLQQHV